MKEYFVFYIVLAVLIVLLIFVVLLYSDYHSRTIVPGLLSTNYPVDEISGNFSVMKITPDSSSTNGSLLFGSGTVDTELDFSFIPIAGDEKRTMSGGIILLIGSSSVGENSVILQVKDLADGKIIGDPSEFLLPRIDKWGLTPIRMRWKTDQTDTRHNIILEIKSANGESISSGRVLLNSAYITYY
jgi:hypothetical protein